MIISRALIALILILLSLTAWAKPSDQWRLHFNGRADSEGQIQLLFEPLGGNPIEVTIDIADGTRENDAARAARDQLREVLDDELFDVDRDDGEEVRIRARRGAADFDLTLLGNTVEGLKVKTDRE
jgi:hypothetical protein